MSKRILSIDFDFFQIIPDVSTLYNCYPDGIDNHPQLSDIIWSNYYQPPTESQLKQVTVDLNKMEQVLTIIKNNHTEKTHFMATNSHVHIYNFIHTHCNNPNETLMIDHLDLHHDILNDNDYLDCGNWITHLKKDYPHINIKWFDNPISCSMYDIKSDEPLYYLIQHELDTLYESNHPYDLIFLCRSDPWFPPHLDMYFDYFLNEMIKTTNQNILTETRIKQPRNLSKS